MTWTRQRLGYLILYILTLKVMYMLHKLRNQDKAIPGLSTVWHSCFQVPNFLRYNFTECIQEYINIWITFDILKIIIMNLCSAGSISQNAHSHASIYITIGSFWRKKKLWQATGKRGRNEPEFSAVYISWKHVIAIQNMS